MTRARWLSEAFAALDRWLPALGEALASHPLAVLESEGNPGIADFKRCGGTGLLVPADYGGLGVGARDAVRLQIAIGALAPSTAVATTMHQFTVATLVELVRATTGFEWMVIEAIATQRLLVASGFAEGDPNGKVLNPTMSLTADGPAFRLTGSKVPCSLARSMDMITVSVKMPGSEDFAVALLPATAEGLRVEPAWHSPVLAGAETAAVLFEHVSVPRAALTYVGASAELDRTQTRGYVWFELCIAAAYLGVASRLASRLVEAGRADEATLVSLALELESGAAMLDHVACRLEADEAGDDLLARALLVRYAVERAIQRSTDLAFELLGVAGLTAGPEVAALFAASRALSYHPPSRRRCQDRLAAYLRGESLRLE
jgi:alkylation response protein AidB-like acyl-CoA dehydrogenase